MGYLTTTHDLIISDNCGGKSAIANPGNIVFRGCTAQPLILQFWAESRRQFKYIRGADPWQTRHRRPLFARDRRSIRDRSGGRHALFENGVAIGAALMP